MLTTYNLVSPEYGEATSIRYDLQYISSIIWVKPLGRGEISHLKCSCCTGPNNLKMETVTSDAACDKHDRWKTWPWSFMDPWSPLSQSSWRNSNTPNSTYESYTVDATIPRNSVAVKYLDSVHVAILARRPVVFTCDGDNRTGRRPHLVALYYDTPACVCPARVPALASRPPARQAACLLGPGATVWALPASACLSVCWCFATVQSDLFMQIVLERIQFFHSCTSVGCKWSIGLLRGTKVVC